MTLPDVEVRAELNEALCKIQELEDELDEAHSRINELEWRLDDTTHSLDPDDAASRMHEWLRENWAGMQIVNDVPFHCALTEWQNELTAVFK